MEIGKTTSKKSTANFKKQYCLTFFKILPQSYPKITRPILIWFRVRGKIDCVWVVVWNPCSNCNNKEVKDFLHVDI